MAYLAILEELMSKSEIKTLMKNNGKEEKV
jgi:hypothetical protein